MAAKSAAAEATQGRSVMLKVTHLGGTSDERPLVFDDRVGTIRFGRSGDCEVRFPAGITAVSKRHFALLRKPGTGTYTFDLSHKKPIYRDGRPVLPGSELTSDAILALGRPNGPQVRIEVMDATSPVPPTEPMEELTDAGTRAAALTRRSRWIGAALAVLALAVAGLGLAFHDTWSSQHSIGAQLAEQSARLSGSRDLGPLIARVKPSVLMIAVRSPAGEFEAKGSAWVFTLPSGEKALATNAHVARIFPAVTAGGQELVVVPPGGGSFRVVQAELHPGYAAFAEVTEALSDKMEQRELRWMSFPSSYDVAIMRVEDPAALPAPLPLAGPDELKALRPGVPLLLVGYPMEDLLGTDVTRPEPQSQQGFITSVTTFWLSYDPDLDNPLIQHSIPVAGGASGSPILNSKGEVIALLNAGNMEVVAKPDGAGGYYNDRAPSAALVNFAQRVDLLDELARGEVDARMALYREQWRDLERQLRRPVDAIIAEFQGIFDAGRLSFDDVVVAGEFQGSMIEMLDAVEIDRPRVAWIEAELDPAALEHLIVAAATDYRPIGLVVLDEGGDIVTVNDAASFFTWSFIGEEVEGRLRIGTYDGSDIATPPDQRAAPGEIKLVIYKALPR